MKAIRDARVWATNECQLRFDALFADEIVVKTPDEQLNTYGSPIPFEKPFSEVLPPECVGDAIECWDFLNRFHAVTTLNHIFFEEFEASLIHPGSLLNAEIHIALIQILLPNLPSLFDCDFLQNPWINRPLNILTWPEILRHCLILASMWFSGNFDRSEINSLLSS